MENENLFGYIRASTDQQSQSLDDQEEALIEAGVEENHIFKDICGGDCFDEQIELQRLIEELEPSQRLLVTKIDRLTRTVNILMYILGILMAKDVHIWPLEEFDEPVATLPSLHECLDLVFIAQEFLTKSRSAREEKRATSQNPFGRPRKITGEKLRELTEQLRFGASKGEIANRLGVSRATVWRAEKRMKC